MPSSDQLTLPAGWTPRQAARQAAVKAVVPIIAVLMGTFGLRGLTGDQPVVSGGFLCLAGVLATSMINLPRDGRRAPVPDPAGGALRFGFSRRQLLAQISGLVLGAGSVLLFAVAAGREGVWFWAVVCALVGAGAAGLLAYRLLSGIRVGELVLSPAAVRLRVDATDVTVDWDHVVGLFPSERRDRYGTVLGRDLHLHTRTVRRAGWRTPPASDVRVPLHRMETDEVALYHLLDFYRRCPQARPELAGPGAVARWSARDFPGG